MPIFIANGQCHQNEGNVCTYILVQGFSTVFHKVSAGFSLTRPSMQTVCLLSILVNYYSKAACDGTRCSHHVQGTMLPTSSVSELQLSYPDVIVQQDVSQNKVLVHTSMSLCTLPSNWSQKLWCCSCRNPMSTLLQFASATALTQPVLRFSQYKVGLPASMPGLSVGCTRLVQR